MKGSVDIDLKIVKLGTFSLTLWEPVEILQNGHYHWIQRIEIRLLTPRTGDSMAENGFCGQENWNCDIRKVYDYCERTDRGTDREMVPLDSAHQIGLEIIYNGILTAFGRYSRGRYWLLWFNSQLSRQLPKFFPRPTSPFFDIWGCRTMNI